MGLLHPAWQEKGKYKLIIGFQQTRGWREEDAMSFYTHSELSSKPAELWLLRL